MRLFYYLMAAVMLLGCSDDDNSTFGEVTQQNLEGTWVIKMINNREVYTNQYFACRFNSNGYQDYLALVTDGESTSFSYTTSAKYQVVNSTIIMLSDIVDLKFPAMIKYDDDGDILHYTESVNIQEGVDVADNRSFTGERTMENYESAIVGMWESTSINGQSVRAVSPVRLDFKRGGEYDLYRFDGGDWVIHDAGCKYALLGDLLALQWSEADGTTTSELWELDIEGNFMEVEAEREGLTYDKEIELIRVVK